MNKYFGFLIGICLTALLLGAMAGCSDDCPVCPEDRAPVDKEYYFVYSFAKPGYWVQTYSTRSMRVVDSLEYDLWPFEDVRFSSDGRLAYYTNVAPGYVTWVTDYASGDTLAVVGGYGGHRLAVSAGDRYLMAYDSRELVIFRLPDLTIIHTDRTRGAQGTFHPQKEIAYITSAYTDTLVTVTLDTLGVHTSSVELLDRRGQPVLSCTRPVVSSDGSWLLLSFWRHDDLPYFQIRDAETYQLLHQFYNVGGGPALIPGGRRALLIQSGGYESPFPSKIYELDLKTLVVRKVLDGSDFQSPFPYGPPLYVNGIDFTPDGRYAVLINGGWGANPAPIVKLDLETYKIAGVAYPPDGRSQVLRMYPLEIKR